MGTSHQTRMRGFTLTLLATSSLATPHYGRQNLDSDEVDQIMEWQHRYNEALQLENEIRLEQQKESEEEDAQARHGDEDDLARKIGLGVGIQLPFGFGAGLSSGLGNGGFGLNAGVGFRGGYTEYGQRPHYSQYYVPAPAQRSALEPPMPAYPLPYVLPSARAVQLNAQAAAGPLKLAAGGGTSLWPLGFGAGAGVGLGPLGLGGSFGAGGGQLGLNAGAGIRGGYAGYGTLPHWSQYYNRPTVFPVYKK